MFTQMTILKHVKISPKSKGSLILTIPLLPLIPLGEVFVPFLLKTELWKLIVLSAPILSQEKVGASQASLMIQPGANNPWFLTVISNTLIALTQG